jgi:hypothetical protein
LGRGEFDAQPRDRFRIRNGLCITLRNLGVQPPDCLVKILDLALSGRYENVSLGKLQLKLKLPAAKALVGTSAKLVQSFSDRDGSTHVVQVAM